MQQTLINSKRECDLGFQEDEDGYETFRNTYTTSIPRGAMIRNGLESIGTRSPQETLTSPAHFATLPYNPQSTTSSASQPNACAAAILVAPRAPPHGAMALAHDHDIGHHATTGARTPPTPAGASSRARLRPCGVSAVWPGANPTRARWGSGEARQSRCDASTRNTSS